MASGVFSKIKKLFGLPVIDEDFYDELEEQLIAADIGVNTAEEIIDALRDDVRAMYIRTPADCREFLMRQLKERMSVVNAEYDFEEKKTVLLIVGVNGVGKTTSIGKLAMQYKQAGRKILLAAADTFRAGAIEQLGIWAQRSGVEMIAQAEGSDPAAVVYDALSAAKARGTDILICDTAGRLHNKKGLMEELKKIYRIIESNSPDRSVKTLIVLDGTTGQNALIQAKEFAQAAKVDGIILTKMDGTAKGGIAIAIQAELHIPVIYIGEGEGINDLKRFDADSYVSDLFT